MRPMNPLKLPVTQPGPERGAPQTHPTAFMSTELPAGAREGPNEHMNIQGNVHSSQLHATVRRQWPQSLRKAQSEGRSKTALHEDRLSNTGSPKQQASTMTS